MTIGESFPINTGFVTKPAQLMTDFSNAMAPESEEDGPGKKLFHTVFMATSEAQQEASAISREGTAKLVTGQLDDFPGYLVDGEKSSILFDLNLQIRNKVLDAYNEIMRTQI